jgi:hypothetical protein
MFMSSREIEAKWQPLDGDREDGYMSGTRSGGTLTGSLYDEDRDVASGEQYRPQYWTPGGRDRAYTQDSAKKNPKGGRALSRKRVYNEVPETDEQLWDRKADEAYNDREIPAKRGNSYTMRSHTTGGRSNNPMGTATANTYEQPQGAHWRHDDATSLGESIEREGVKSPIHLGRTVGSMGKPEIVGGHHRMAVMRNLNPDQLMPVLHHTDIFEARSDSMEKFFGGYT